MAGGRRPSNFAASSRHAATDAHQAAASSSYSYNYSIWQQPHVHSSPPATQRPVSLPAMVPVRLPSSGPAVGHAADTAPGASAGTPAASVAADVADAVAPTVANALATALDAAVRAAVSEHMSLALASGGKRASERISDPAESSSPFSVGSSIHRRGGDRVDHGAPHDEQALTASSASFNHVVGSSRDSSVSGGDIGAAEWQVESEVQERKRDVSSLRLALERLESRIDANESASRDVENRDNERNAALVARVEAAEASARKSAAEVLTLRKTLKDTQGTLSDLRMQKRKSDSDSERLRSRVSDLESQLETIGREVEAIPQRVDACERRIAAEEKARKPAGRESPRSVVDLKPQVGKAVEAADAARRESSDALEALTALRSRVKRVEDMTAKRADETSTELAMQNGAIERLRGNTAEVAVSLQGLKRLVEANLRSHSSAEGIVKDQAQLITRHVCVALRQFIARRISENNQLIDKTLRARVPVYAESNSSFVLVRSETDGGADDPPILSTAASTVSAEAGGSANAALYPLEAVEEAVTSETALAALQ